GVLGNSGRQRLDSVNVLGARAAAEATRASGVKSFVHVSALGADKDAPSEYARSKAAGEAAVFETLPDAVVMRPSFIFGPEDRFFNRFASLARFAPIFPVIGGGATRLQPVFAGDVARAIADAVEGKATPGAPYELGGPEVKTLTECIAFALAEADRRRLLMPLPWPLARLAGGILQHLPGRVITVDQVRQLEADNVVSEAALGARRTLAAFDVQPTSIAAIVPSYLVRFRPRGQFQRPRAAGGHRRRLRRAFTEGDDCGDADGADDDAPPAKQAEAMPADEAEECPHHDQRRDEGGDEADGDHRRRAH